MSICLLNVPFGNVENPSIALSLLQAALKTQGVSSWVYYANLEFAQEIGLKAYTIISWNGEFREVLPGEYVFSQAAFADYSLKDGYPEFVKQGMGRELAAPALASFLEYLEAARQAAVGFVDKAAKRILAANARIVACASSVQQNCAALAILRRVKELDPAIVTILGGPNCEGSMGQALVTAFPWLDYVVSGEADDFFADFCADLLQSDGKLPESELPYGVLTRTGITAKAPAPRRVVKCMENVPIPDYDDYFTALAKHGWQDNIKPGLLIETSRGCWWGEKHACLFCGLNGAVRVYRTKSAARVIDELAYLSERYNNHNIFATDCILAVEHIREVMPRLAEREKPYNLMYEVKSNLTQAQLAVLAKAGVRWLQPGIESLQDDLLTLMHKGNRAIMHIELLKNCLQLGIRCCWNMIYGFPEEKLAWYEEMNDYLPLITHFQPPNFLLRLRYDRFSAYHEHQEQYGLTLVAAPAYTYIYPDIPGFPENIAYFFEDKDNSRPLSAHSYPYAVYARLGEFIDSWNQGFWGPGRDYLVARQCGGQLEIIDLRACAVSSLHILTGAVKAVHEACAQVVSRQRLAQKIQADTGKSYSASQVSEAVAELIEKKLLLAMGDELLALALPGLPPPLPPPSAYPLGQVSF